MNLLMIMAKTGTSKSRNCQYLNLIVMIIMHLYRQNDGTEMVNIAYTHHHSFDEEATDYDVPPKKYKNIRFNKETHPLSLMVLYTAYTWSK